MPRLPKAIVARVRISIYELLAENDPGWGQHPSGRALLQRIESPVYAGGNQVYPKSVQARLREAHLNGQLVVIEPIG